MSRANIDMDVADSDALGPSNPSWSIFLVSVLGLFLELMLIRWVSTEVRIFAYLQNTVLVVCFLGLGMGCFTSRRRVVLRNLLVPLLSIIVIFAIPVTRRAFGRISDLLSELGGLLIWHPSVSTDLFQTIGHVSVGLGLTFMLMLLIWEIFVPVGRLLGRLLDDHPHTIWAYSVNIAGSLLGIWLFVLLSALGQPPVAWCAVAVGLLAFYLGTPGRRRRIDIALLAAIVVFGWFASREPGSVEVRWSPYQKLVVIPSREDALIWPGKYFITVNNTGYQAMIDLSERSVRSSPQIYDPRLRGLSQYDIPLLLHPDPARVLIVGAGAGNDVAGALRNGGREITAVEIDPAIISQGRRFHPEMPYDSPRVRVVNDDARSFFARSKERYDLIIFGLLDSHTTTAMTNARLDHYVYTRESIQRAKSLLDEGGIIVMSFEAQKPYIADRLARVLREVTGEEPISFRVPGGSYGWGGIMFVAGDRAAAARQIAANARLASWIEALQQQFPVPLTYTTRVATDDWPYIYLETPHIPPLYYVLAGMLLLLVVRCKRRLKTATRITGWSRWHWHFFFMGAAFLLLEVQNISKASVVLGNTWWVNAVIISGILIMILLANWIAAKFPNLSLGAVYLGLVGTCVGLYFVDISRFAFLPYVGKATVVGTLTTLPMLFSGIVFIRSFAVTTEKDAALGANLMGALVGALLQSVTFLTGIKALLLVVAGLYVAALVTIPPGTAREQNGAARGMKSDESESVAKRASAGTSA